MKGHGQERWGSPSGWDPLGLWPPVSSHSKRCFASCTWEGTLTCWRRTWRTRNKLWRKPGRRRQHLYVNVLLQWLFEKLKWYFQLAEVMATVNQEFIVWTLDLIKQAQIKFSGIIHNLDKLKTPHLQGAVNPLPWTPWPVAIPVYLPGGDDLSLQQQRAPRGREGRGWG